MCTETGGVNDEGTIFKIKPDGTGFLKIHDFADSFGRYPDGSLLLDGAYLYGMTANGGEFGEGTIFKIKPDGTGFSLLQEFSGSGGGRNPYGSLLKEGAFFYGMTSGGGSTNDGVVFQIMPDGSGYSEILDMEASTTGSNPYGSLISDGTFLYGMANSGGNDNIGTIFKIKPDGSGFVKMLDMVEAPNGSYPSGDLIYDGTFLYGLTSGGGAQDNGTYFKIKTDGTGFLKLLDFDG